MKTKITKEQANLVKNLFIAGYLAFLIARVDIYLAQKTPPEVVEAKNEEKSQSYEPVEKEKTGVSESQSYPTTSFATNAISSTTHEAKNTKEHINTSDKQEDIKNYIREVFEEHSDKAFLLLSGNEKCGGENPTLNPKAVNVNRDGSRDRGIFQINNKYHPLTDEQAFDYKTNVQYAYRMFQNDNYTFSKRWAAGKCLAKHGYEI